MQENKKKLPLIVGILLLVIGVSFAYYTGKLLFGGAGANVNGVTTVIKGTTVTVEGNLSFNDQNILPGHKNVSSIKVTAIGSNELVPFNLVWTGTNELGTPLNYTVYKTTINVEVSATCEQIRGTFNGNAILSEECNISNIDSLGNIIASGTINTSQEETKLIITTDEFITATSSGEIVYYYVILEYPNLDEPQNNDIGGSFGGTITAEGSGAIPDITISGVYLADEAGTYTRVEEVPTSGYTLNSSKSTCSNNTVPKYVDGKVIMSNLTKEETNCSLYFDIKPYTCSGVACETIMANMTSISERNDFSTTYEATTTGTIFTAEDDDGTSYYYAGSPTDNWVKFGGFYWRIVRINGDGTIRLIYNGTTTATTGEGTNAVNNVAFNTNYNDNAYVGFMYTLNEVHGLGTSSNAKTQLDKWYTANLANVSAYIDNNAGFCGDRGSNISDAGAPNETGGTGTTITYYAARYRLYVNKIPTLKCADNSDLYTKIGATKGNKLLTNPVGLIIGDEVAYAGGVYLMDNRNYYLYNNQYQWTMTPFIFYLDGTTHMLSVDSDGELYSRYVNSDYGLRPVINLRADTVFKSGSKGTIEAPYIVNGAE